MKIQKSVSFSRIPQILDLPDLMAVQKGSFEGFLQKDVPFAQRSPQGLQAAFLDVFPIVSADEAFSIEFVRYEVSDPPYSEEESRLRDLSYAGQLSAYLRLVEHPTSAHPKTIIEQQVFFGDLPLMTEGATFIINGAERVVVSQLHRSPGVIFEEDEEKGTSSYGKKLYVAKIIPYRGAWVEFEFDINNILYVSMDKKKRFEATAFLCALGLDTTEKILSAFYETEEVEISRLVKSQTTYQSPSPEAADVMVEPSTGLRILAEDVVNKKTGEVILEANKPLTQEALESLKSQGVKSVRCIIEACRNDVAIRETLKRDRPKPRKEANIDIYRKLRGSEHMVDPKQAESFLENLILKNTRRYDLTRVGRYKINKKLAPVFENLARRPNYKRFSFEIPSERRRTLSLEDIVATLQYLVALNNGTGGEMDDIDHLGNRRIRAVGELLENQVRVGLAHMAKLVRDRMATRERSEMTPHKILNTQPVGGMIRKFFGTSQLSQFMDQTNPLAELTHKRRLSALGPGGLHRKRAGFEVRDVHHTHYGRICPIETPEGPNIGLITSLACHARVNEYGLIESPYQRVKNARLSGDVDYLIADKEDEFVVAQANSPLDKSGRLIGERALCRHRGDFREVEPSQISYMDVSPLQVVSVSAALVPFLEHDDANRALMGSNMQRQAVPLLITDPPWVATGIEERVAKDSLATITARREGKVVGVSASRIDLWTEGEGKGGRIDTYRLIKYRRANQDTCVNQVPLVRVGERVRRGQALADGSATAQGQLALGKNLLVAFMSWEGYNFEDAILLSERLVREDVFTSIHIQEFVLEARETKMGPEEITRDIPNVGKDGLAHLDEDGIILPGAAVSPGDILVGKVVPKGEQHTTPEERLLRVIFGRKAEDVMDASLRLPPGSSGKVLDVRVFTRKEKISKADEKRLLEEIDEEFRTLEAEVKKAGEEMESEERLERKVITALVAKRLEDLKAEKSRRKESVRSGDRLEVTVNKKVKVYVVSQRKIQVGDKMAGRHGNKGVVAKILPVEDMPHLPDGTPLDIVLSPLSVPSRMNVGQILETMLGWAANVHHTQMISPVFDGAKEGDVRQSIREANESLKKQGIPERYLPTEDARITLYDGRTGEPFHEKVTVGYMYIMKLAHLVEDKMHARSTGPYSLITRQPLGGKAQFGGQRFGEMEVWALEGYGAAHTLQEFLTIKSDDVVGRTKMYEAIIEGKAASPPGTPESFKVLIQELQGLGIQIDLRKQIGRDGKNGKGKKGE